MAQAAAHRDQGATPWQSFWRVVLPPIGPSVVGIGMFGFTLSRDEIARSSQAIYALGTVTTSISLLVTAVALAGAVGLSRRRSLG